jgi:hypothetical protein
MGAAASTLLELLLLLLLRLGGMSVAFTIPCDVEILQGIESLPALGHCLIGCRRALSVRERPEGSIKHGGRCASQDYNYVY